jgi:hypothetical protein
MKQLTITNGFTRMSDDNLSVKASQINAAMTGNPSFVDPVPSLADLSDAIEAFNTALNNSRDGDRLKAAIKNQKREELIELLHLLADYVLFKSEGDTVTAMSSGFTIGKSPEPREITKPQNPRLLQGENSGELIPKVDRVPGAIGYLHQYATEAEMAQAKWTTIPSSRSKCRIANLTPGTRYFYRVAALGTKDQLIYSDVVNRIAA